MKASLAYFVDNFSVDQFVLTRRQQTVIRQKAALFNGPSFSRESILGRGKWGSCYHRHFFYWQYILEPLTP